MAYDLEPLIDSLTHREEITDDQLHILRVAVLAEQERRVTIDTSASQAEQINQRYVAAIGRADGDPWTQPVGAHDAHPQGAIVTHGGKTWESTTPNNVWEPGVSGWREQVTDDPDTGEPGVPDYVQPTGGHDAYQIGDRVRFDGKVYESIIASNVWSPAAHAAGWKLIA